MAEGVRRKIGYGIIALLFMGPYCNAADDHRSRLTLLGIDRIGLIVKSFKAEEHISALLGVRENVVSTLKSSGINVADRSEPIYTEGYPHIQLGVAVKPYSGDVVRYRISFDFMQRALPKRGSIPTFKKTWGIEINGMAQRESLMKMAKESVAEAVAIFVEAYSSVN
jgi:hypothetical protein